MERMCAAGRVGSLVVSRFKDGHPGWHSTIGLSAASRKGPVIELRDVHDNVSN
jgi:hypothetical protein